MRPKYHNKWWRVELNRFDGLKLTSTMHYRRRINQRVMVKESYWSIWYCAKSATTLLTASSKADSSHSLPCQKHPQLIILHIKGPYQS